jgi:hypothetical protein
MGVCIRGVHFTLKSGHHAARKGSPHCPGHSSGVARRTPADLPLFVEPLELFLHLFAAVQVALDANRPFPRGQGVKAVA